MAIARRKLGVWLSLIVIVCWGFASAQQAWRPAGSWQGKLTMGPSVLRVVFNLQAEGEQWSGTLDSPDQAAFGLKFNAVQVDGMQLHVELTSARASYNGTWNPATQQIEGMWSQSGQSMPLTLTPSVSVTRTLNPQEPTKPYPYVEEEVRFANPAAGVQMAGTLTKPQGVGKFPAVLLLSGSGAQDRDETILGHKPFLVIADYLTRQGFAVLRVDDRGVGGSTGDMALATIDDFVSDALVAVNYLKTRNDVDAKHIGLIGHSEGGLVAPMTAVQSDDVAYVVLLAGPGMTGHALLELQAQRIFQASGASEAYRQAYAELQHQAHAIVMAEPVTANAIAKVQALVATATPKLTASVVNEVDRAIQQAFASTEGSSAYARALSSPYMRYFLMSDPSSVLSRVKCPVLALNGSLDMQVPAEENLAGINAALRQANNKNFATKSLPGLNHLFQTAVTGAPEEYAKIDQTFAPEALRVMGNWLKQQAGLSSR